MQRNHLNILAFTLTLSIAPGLVAQDKSFSETFLEEFSELEAFTARAESLNKPTSSAWEQVSPPVPWHTSLSLGYAEAVAKHLPLVVVFHADWCLWCNRLKNGVLSRQELRDYGDDAVFVLQDPGADDAFGNVSRMLSKLEVESFPVTIVLDVSSHRCNEIGRIVGYHDSEKFLKQFHGLLRLHPATDLPQQFKFNSDANQVDPDGGSVTSENLEQLATYASVSTPKSIGAADEPCYEIELITGNQPVTVQVTMSAGSDLVWLHAPICTLSGDIDDPRRVAQLYAGSDKLHSAILRSNLESRQIILSRPFASSHVSADYFCELAREFAAQVESSRSNYSEDCAQR